VVNAATAAILELLFVFPATTAFPRLSIAECHAEFARNHIENLCSDYEELAQKESATDPRRFFQGIDLLSAVLFKSKQTAAAFDLKAPAENLLIDNLQGDSGIIHFTAHVYGAEVQPKVVTVSARKSTKVSELLSRLPPLTGAGENRVIAGGAEITHLSDKSLSEVGIEHPRVIMIRPKYSYDLDFDRVLTSPGPVEQEILDQFESLDKFLDGPESLAQRVT
jgi:hypothetical protein